MERSSFTECCVGSVLISPAMAGFGTSVRWMKSVLSAPVSSRSCRAASRNGCDSMSPHGAAHRHDHRVEALTHGKDAALDFIRDVGDHLHRAAQIIPRRSLRITSS